MLTMVEIASTWCGKNTRTRSRNDRRLAMTKGPMMLPYLFLVTVQAHHTSGNRHCVAITVNDGGDCFDLVREKHPHQVSQ
jgi:hypothetical protein